MANSRTMEAMLAESARAIEQLTQRIEDAKDAMRGPLTAEQELLKALQDQLKLEKQKLATAEEMAKLEASITGRMRDNLSSIPHAGGVVAAVGRHSEARSEQKQAAQMGLGGGEQLMASLNTMSAAFGVVGATASAVTGAFQEIVGTARGFVEAFAPSTVQILDQAMRDLQATIGVALVPIIQGAAGFVREFGSALLPVMERLRPVVQSLSDTFGAIASRMLAQAQPFLDALAPLGEAIAAQAEAVAGIMEPLMAFGSIMTEIGGAAMQLLAGAIKELLIVLQPFIAVFQMAGDALRAFSAVAGAVIESLVSSLGGGGSSGFKDIADQMRSAFQQIIKASVLVAAGLMKMFNMGGVVDNLKKKLAGPERKDNTGIAAATNSSFKSFGDLGKQVSMAAAIASGDGGEKKEQIDFLKDIADAVVKMSGESLSEIITNAVKAAIPGGKTYDKVVEINEQIFGRGKNFLGSGWDALNASVGG